MRKAFNNSIVSETKELFDHTGKTGDDFDQETIHELRTHFKKIRALLRWQQANKRSYTFFKNIYEQAGKIRNIQVAQEILKNEAGIPEEFNNWLNAKLIYLKKEWHTGNKKKIERKLLQHFKKVKFAQHKKFFPCKMESIQQIAGRKVISDTDMHQVRKEIKDIQYASEWWKKNTDAQVEVLKNIPVAKLKKIGIQIGNYNDKCTLINLFKIYLVVKKETVGENMLLKKWQQEKAFFKQYLADRIRHIQSRSIQFTRVSIMAAGVNEDGLQLVEIPGS